MQKYILSLAVLLLFACSNIPDIENAEEITQTELSEMQQNDKGDHIAYYGSDNNFHYFVRSPLDKSQQMTYKITNDKLEVIGKFPVAKEGVLFHAAFDKQKDKWVAVTEGEEYEFVYEEEERSILRPDEQLEPGKIYTDTVYFDSYSNDEEFMFFAVRVGENYELFLYESDDFDGFIEGDELEIKWKLDSIFVDDEEKMARYFLVDVQPIGAVGEIKSNYWAFEKANVYGGYESGKEYGVSREELYEQFGNVSFRISYSYVIYDEDHLGNASVEYSDISGFFSGKLDENETPETIKKWFKKEFGVTMTDELRLLHIESGSVKYPFHRMIVFPEKILMFTQGAFYASFVRSPLPAENPDVTCETFDIEMGQREECTYKNFSMQQAYEHIRKEPLNKALLKESIPQADTSYSVEHEGSRVDIKYEFKDSMSHLFIELGFAGGVTTMTFTEEETQTLVVTEYSAD